MGTETDVKPDNLYIYPPISPEELIGRTFQDEHGYKLPFGKGLIHFYVVDGKERIDILGVQEGYIGGRYLNQLLHSIKPRAASFEIDTHDLLNDWSAIDLPENVQRLARHAAMPGWNVFYSEKDIIWNLIKNAYAGKDGYWQEEEPNEGMKGVIWWRVNSDSSKEVILEKLAGSMNPAYQYILKAHMNPHEYANLSTVVGSWLLAYISPEIRKNTKIWKPRDGYGGDCDSITFNMGTTQVGVMALRYADTFLTGRFIASAEEYILSFQKR